jgi:DNA-binding response OmpR family regulator
MARILIVDDESDNLVLLKMILSRAGHTVYPLMRATHLKEEIEQVKPELLVLDLLLPGITGGTAYEMVRSCVSETLPIIVSSGTKIKLRKRNDHALRYCPKPIDIADFIKAVDELLAQAKGKPLADEDELDLNEDEKR